MTLSSTILVPELQYYFNNFVVNSVVNKYEVPLPVPVDLIFLTSNTVVELLFNDDFSGTDYTYLYSNLDDKSTWPTLSRQRLMIYSSAKYYVPDSAGSNVFNLQAHDFILLDALLQYRIDSTSLTIIDSTSIQLITDSTSNTSILYANFNLLSTPLSKLIFLYLNLKIYNNYENYNNLNLVTSGTLLETCFELKLLDEYFSLITDREISFAITCS